MLSVKTLRDVLMPLSPQMAIDHWVRVFEKHGDSPDFENPRVQITTRSGSDFMGYLVSAGSPLNSKDRYVILSLIIKSDTDQARDIVYLNVTDIEAIAFFDIDPIMQFLMRK